MSVVFKKFVEVMDTWKGLILKIMFGLYGPALILLIGLQMYASFAVLASTLAGASIAIQWNRKKTWIGFAGTIAYAIWFVLWPPSELISDYHEGTKNLANLIQIQKRPTLPIQSNLAIYGLNGLMAFGGLIAGYPEAARETWNMMFRAKVRRWESDFFLASPKIQSAITSSIKRISRGEKIIQTRVGWRRYDEPGEPKRVSLALNATTITVEKKSDRFFVKATTPIRYPKKATAVVADNFLGQRVVVQESLFWALEKQGWLHPYSVEWITYLPLDWQPTRSTRP